MAEYFVDVFGRVVKSISDLLSLAALSRLSAPESGVLSAEESVSQHLRFVHFPMDELEFVLKTCCEEMQQYKAEKSKKDRLPNVSLRLFLETLVLVARSAGASMLLPSKAGYESKHAPKAKYKDRPLFRFSRTMLELAGVRAELVLQKRLSLKEARDAQAHLNSFSTLKDSTIVGYLHEARGFVTSGDPRVRDQHPEFL